MYTVFLALVSLALAAADDYSQLGGMEVLSFQLPYIYETFTIQHIQSARQSLVASLQAADVSELINVKEETVVFSMYDKLSNGGTRLGFDVLYNDSLIGGSDIVSAFSRMFNDDGSIKEVYGSQFHTDSESMGIPQISKMADDSTSFSTPIALSPQPTNTQFNNYYIHLVINLPLNDFLTHFAQYAAALTATLGDAMLIPTITDILLMQCLGFDDTHIRCDFALTGRYDDATGCEITTNVDALSAYFNDRHAYYGQTIGATAKQEFLDTLTGNGFPSNNGNNAQIEVRLEGGPSSSGSIPGSCNDGPCCLYRPQTGRRLMSTLQTIEIDVCVGATPVNNQTLRVKTMAGENPHRYLAGLACTSVQSQDLTSDCAPNATNIDSGFLNQTSATDNSTIICYKLTPHVSNVSSFGESLLQSSSTFSTDAVSRFNNATAAPLFTGYIVDNVTVSILTAMPVVEVQKMPLSLAAALGISIPIAFILAVANLAFLLTRKEGRFPKQR
jgi:hypothetical protein